MRKRVFDQETVLAHIWNHADIDGLWDGDAESMAEELGVSEDEAYDALRELCDGGLVEKIPGKYAIVMWRERDQPAEEFPN